MPFFLNTSFKCSHNYDNNYNHNNKLVTQFCKKHFKVAECACKRREEKRKKVWDDLQR